MHVTNQQMHIDKICLLYIAIYQHVSIVSANITVVAEMTKTCW
jgi:hypothetical protein